jgi:hypothetical protein
VPLSLPESDITRLKELGELLNYNGYGPTVDDLHLPPADLYRAVSDFTEPLDFYAKSEVLARLKEGYHADMDRALAFQPVRESHHGRVFELPAEPWARRVSGVFSNLKAQEKPDLAHALLIPNQDKTYRVNVRAPLRNKQMSGLPCGTNRAPIPSAALFPPAAVGLQPPVLTALPRNSVRIFLINLKRCLACNCSR